MFLLFGAHSDSCERSPTSFLSFHEPGNFFTLTVENVTNESECVAFYFSFDAFVWEGVKKKRLNVFNYVCYSHRVDQTPVE